MLKAFIFFLRDYLGERGERYNAAQDSNRDVNFCDLAVEIACCQTLAQHLRGLKKSWALAYSDGSKGGRPPFDPVLMFKILDAIWVAAPRQRNTNTEKADLRAGRIPEDWQDCPKRIATRAGH